MENKKEKRSIVTEMVEDLLEIYHRDFANKKDSPQLTEKELKALNKEVEKLNIQKKVDEATEGRGLY